MDSPKDHRKQSSSCLLLSDLISNRTWPELKIHFKEVFLLCLGFLEHEKDNVKIAAYQLVKSIRRITLKIANVYTNENEKELEEILDLVVPMLLDDCLGRSQIKTVRFFAVDVLGEIVKSSQEEATYMAEKLGIKVNKYDKQLAFSYNSFQKMKTILNKYLDRIIVEVISNLSTMSAAVTQINMIEQMMAQYGKKMAKKSGMSESQLNEMRLKYTSGSPMGDILRVCRNLITAETFEKVLPNLLNLMKTGHDLTTRSTAITFINEMMVENKYEGVIDPKQSKRIANKMIETYSLATV